MEEQPAGTEERPANIVDPSATMEVEVEQQDLVASSTSKSSLSKSQSTGSRSNLKVSSATTGAPLPSHSASATNLAPTRKALDTNLTGSLTSLKAMRATKGKVGSAGNLSGSASFSMDNRRGTRSRISLSSRKEED